MCKNDQLKNPKNLVKWKELNKRSIYNIKGSRVERFTAIAICPLAITYRGK